MALFLKYDLFTNYLGESVPETKTPLLNDEIVYVEALHKKHTLLCGTSVIHNNGVNGKGSRALVLNTGLCSQMLYLTCLCSDF